MRTLLVSGVCVLFLAVVGCKNQNHDNGSMNPDQDSAQRMSIDACPHCPGVQTATADGKCPVCGGPAVKQ